MIKEAISKIVDGCNLTSRQMQAVMEEIMQGKASPATIASFLTAMRMKGETADEITGAVKVMRRFATRIPSSGKVILDTCGTGGDRRGTFNISTVTAFVVAGSGIAVAKHGNRAVSSCCGSADLLEALGVNVHMNAAQLKNCLEEIGIAFLFAPNLHPAMKHALPVRKELGIKTLFNIVGPLSNPAQATHQLIGVYDRNLLTIAAKVLRNLGTRHAMVVHGADGLDEITTTTKTYVCELKAGKIKLYTINSLQFGIKKSRLEDLKSLGIASHVKIALQVLKGERGSKRDIVLLNAAAAIYTADKVRSIKEGLQVAAESIDSGKAFEKLERLRGYP